MSKDQIVIVTQIADAHADDVIMMLQELGHAAIRLNSDDIPANTLMSFGLDNSGPFMSGGIQILTNGRAIDVEAIRSVWWRRPSRFGLPANLSEQERTFATDEIEHALGSIWSVIDSYWISHPDYIRQASWKGEQLVRASKLGFEIPRTLITSDPNEARNFYDDCNGKMIFKVMTDSYLGASKMSNQQSDHPHPENLKTPTTLISDLELELFDSIRSAPCLFQEYVQKQLELRVTIIGDDVFAAEIHSQDDERTSIDWRNYDVEIPYRKASLPVDVEERCVALVRSYQLNFSAIDLILTHDGRYVFVENNPNGQFIFVEDRVPELRMTEALAARLVRGSSS